MGGGRRKGTRGGGAEKQRLEGMKSRSRDEMGPGKEVSQDEREREGEEFGWKGLVSERKGERK